MWTPSIFLTLSLLSLFLTSTSAQQDISTLPQCGQNCFNVAFAEFSRSCPARDAACLCSQPGFNPEITACTDQQCGSGTGFATQTLGFLQAYCAGAAGANSSSSSTTSSTVVVTLTTSSGTAGSSSVVMLTQTLPVSNTTSPSGNTTVVVSMRSTGTSGVVSSTSGGGTSTTGSATGTGTGAASPTVSRSANAGFRVGSDVSIVFSLVVLGWLSMVVLG